jgi:hypothetical protein
MLNGSRYFGGLLMVRVLLLLGLMLSPFFGQAQTELVCFTTADALEELKFSKFQNKDYLDIMVNVQTGVQRYEVIQGIESIKNAGGGTIVAAKDPSVQFGGAYANAVLLEMRKGQKQAILAMNKKVYQLKCRQEKIKSVDDGGDCVAKLDFSNAKTPAQCEALEWRAPHISIHADVVRFTNWEAKWHAGTTNPKKSLRNYEKLRFTWRMAKASRRRLDRSL